MTLRRRYQKKKNTSKLKKRINLAGIFIFLSTLLLILFILVIFSIIPKSTFIELTAYAKLICFSSADGINEDEIPLLHSSILLKSIEFTNFESFQITINSINNINRNLDLIINPGENAIVKFFEISNGTNNNEISLQQLICSYPGELLLNCDANYFQVEITSSDSPPYEIISFEGAVGIWTNNCDIIDKENNRYTQLFEDSVIVDLSVNSKMLKIIGNSENFISILEESHDEFEAEIYFFIENEEYNQIQNLSFEQRISKTSEISTIDTICIKKRSSRNTVEFKSRGAGDINLLADPNNFTIYELVKQRDLIKIRAQGRFKQFRIGQGAISFDQVPAYLSFIAHNQNYSVIIACLAWLISVFFPFILKIISQRRS